MSEAYLKQWLLLLKRTPATSSHHVQTPNLEAMKRRRVNSQTAAGWICAVTGLIVLGVPGTIIGGLAGNKSTRQRMETRPRQITNCDIPISTRKR